MYANKNKLNFMEFHKENSIKKTGDQPVHNLCSENF